ncbi:hypothetical protein [Cytobacillus horneckiae]|uniref:hypothetical protein n=1 Tax=Cytobacillus horneckiae TaxID=549687 RepID=UPI002041214D|nr:hypothetical protein [Cytobacillus horneckiae]MCM3180863.1 hypothetical protein [Cytobacillus horneckiae]
MFDIQITGTNIRYTSEGIFQVHVQFQAYDPERQISINGYIPFTAEQYEGNEVISALKELVRVELVNRLEPEAV